MSIKDSTFDTLVRYYDKIKDLDKFVKVCNAMLVDEESTPVMRGEIAETVLYVLLDDYIKKNNLTDWRISKGLILKDINKDPSNEYFTELDLTLFTPKCIFSFECKSYKGSKYLTDSGTLKVKRGNTYKVQLDVFDQHSKHFDVLFENIKCALDDDVYDKRFKSFKLLYFDFSDSPTVDKREQKYRRIFPIINENNLYSLFNKYDERPNYWNMKIVNKVVDIIEKNKKANTKRHLKYVTGLRNSRTRVKQ